MTLLEFLDLSENAFDLFFSCVFVGNLAQFIPIELPAESLAPIWHLQICIVLL